MDKRKNWSEQFYNGNDFTYFFFSQGMQLVVFVTYHARQPWSGFFLSSHRPLHMKPQCSHLWREKPKLIALVRLWNKNVSPMVSRT